MAYEWGCLSGSDKLVEAAGIEHRTLLALRKLLFLKSFSFAKNARIANLGDMVGTPTATGYEEYEVKAGTVSGLNETPLGLRRRSASHLHGVLSVRLRRKVQSVGCCAWMRSRHCGFTGGGRYGKRRPPF